MAIPALSLTMTRSFLLTIRPQWAFYSERITDVEIFSFDDARGENVSLLVQTKKPWGRPLDLEPKGLQGPAGVSLNKCRTLASRLGLTSHGLYGKALS
jgi:hypothetical protein